MLTRYFSWRFIERNVVVAIAVVATVCLCIAANSTAFSVLNGLILKPLPFHRPSEILEVYNQYTKAGLMKVPVSVGQFVDYEKNASGFQSFALAAPWTATLVDRDVPAREVGVQCTDTLFHLIGVVPYLGRFFNRDDCRAGNDKVIILSEGLWRERYGADPGVIGKKLTFSDGVYTVVGVAPKRAAHLNSSFKLYKPIVLNQEASLPDARHAFIGTMYARLSPGLPPSAGEAELRRLEARFYYDVGSLAILGHRDAGGHTVSVGSLRSEQAGSVKNGVLIVQVSAAALLLVAVINLCGLLLASANVRRAEFAVKQALGAAPADIAIQCIFEVGVLVFTGGVLGVLLSVGIMQSVNGYLRVILPDAVPISIDITTIFVSLGLCVVGTLALGGAQALRVGRPAPLEALQQQQPGRGSAGRRIRRLGSALVVGQVALAAVLVVVSVLLIRSYIGISRSDPGFSSQSLLHMRISLSPQARGAEENGVHERITAGIEEIPGISAVALMPGDPAKGVFPPGSFPVAGRPESGRPTTALAFEVQRNFFQATAIPLVLGTGFETLGGQVSDEGFVIDQRFASMHFGDENPVGREIVVEVGSQTKNVRILGVARNARFTKPDDRNPMPVVYSVARRLPGNFALWIRTERKIEDVLPLIRAKVRDVDPAAPVYEAQYRVEIESNMLSERRGVTLLLTAFAFASFCLAAIGVFAIITFETVQRSSEMAVRLALGASRMQLLGVVIKQVATVVCAGLAAGFILSYWGIRAVSSMLVLGGGEAGSAVFLIVTAAFGLGALVASYLPCRRVLRTDPASLFRAS